jgi:TRAP-type C4-dicarboxylate transport system substrate-binding protein
MNSRQGRKAVFRIALLLAAVLLGAGSAAAETYTLKVTTFLPPNYFFLTKVVGAWGQELEQKSGGRLKLEIYPASQMGPPPRQFDLARTGVADIAIFAHGLTPGRFPLTEIMQLPFMTPGGAVSAQTLMDLAPEYLAQEHPGTRILWMWTAQPSHVFTRSTPILKVADFKGLRIRHPSQVTDEILTALGATTVNVQPPDIAEALDKGTIDGTNFPYDGVATFRLGNSLKYVLEIGMSAQTWAGVLNENTYNNLPPDLRKLIDDTTGRSRAKQIGEAGAENELQARKYAIDSGIKVTTLSPDELAKAKQLTAPVTERYLASLEARGLPARAVYRRMQELAIHYSADK